MWQRKWVNSRSLIKNIPNKSQQWKAPVSVWIEELYEERQAKANKKKKIYLYFAN